MHVTPLDWVIVVATVLVALVPSLFFIRRAGKATAEFFASGRSAPWWLAGTSMVATTFSTDTPNLVTHLVREKGVANNWVWWAFLVTGMLTTFFYARLWRRSGALTDLEFYEVRYAGKSAAAVRGFRAIYLGLFFNCVIMASVTLAAVKIANVVLGWDRLTTVLVCAGLAAGFSLLSGLWGVLVADLIQFVFAMTGAVAVAWFALKQPEVGGLSGLVSRLDPSKLNLLPDFGSWDLTLSILIIPLTIQWWSVWYPGAEPGGGSYVAQRILACKNEKHAVGATLWFNVAHYAIRPWPWILVALCSLLVFPKLSDISAALPHVDPTLVGHDMAYPAMIKFLPAGFMGLMIASLLAAYISTMDTHLNWGASYLVHDLYQRFVRPKATERHYVLVSRIVTAALMAAAAGLMFLLETARENFDIMLSIGAGTGLIYLLRWFWWRVNAWSEIAAMISSFVISVGLFVANKHGAGIPTHLSLVASVAFTTVVWLAVTFLTHPTKRDVLVRFYRLVRPFGPGWADIRRETGLGPSPDSLPHCLLGWVLGCVLVYTALFGTGSLLYGRTAQGIACLIPCALSAAGLVWLLPKLLGGARDTERG